MSIRVSLLALLLSGSLLSAQEIVQPVEPQPAVEADERDSDPGPYIGDTLRDEAIATAAKPRIATHTVTDDANGNMIFSTSGVERMRITAAGDVGIATTTPGSALHVNGHLQALGISNGTHLPTVAGGQVRSVTSAVTGYLKITLPQSWTATMMLMHVDLYDYQSNRGRTLVLGGFTHPTLSWQRTFASQIASDDQVIHVDFGHDGTNAAIYLSKGTLGVSTIWTYPQVVVRDFFAGYNNSAAANWDDGWNVNSSTTLGTISAMHDIKPTFSGVGTANVVPKFGSANTLISSGIYETSAGNVGIGNTAPAAKLDVTGTIRAQSIAGPNWTGAVANAELKGFKVLGAVYQDVAEWVPSTTDLAPGTVVILNREKTNEVMASYGAYDTSVAGVVSEQPGLILGMEGEGREQVATTGRVKVRVDARRAAIAVGDLLVTSDLPGTAMKSEPMEIQGRHFHQPGTIVGKALEPLAGGVGEILVLLSMQ